MKIIYQNQDNTIAIIIPVEGCGLTVEQIAQKDVPHGVPYLIVEDSDLPSDWSTSAAWEADFSAPHGIGMGPQRYFIAQAAAVIENPESTPEQIEAAMLLSEQMQREIIELEGAPM
jgi:hypothetical protein